MLNCPSPADSAKLQAVEEAQYLGDRNCKAAKAQVWAKLCQRVDLELKPVPDVVLTRAATSGPSDFCRPGTGRRAATQEKAFSFSLNLECSWHLAAVRVSASGCQPAPAEPSADEKAGEQVEKEQDSTKPSEMPVSSIRVWSDDHVGSSLSVGLVQTVQ
eukprot:1398931-Rhodomonas_salina.1